MRLHLSVITVVTCLVLSAGVTDAASSKSSSSCSSSASAVCKAPAVKKAVKKAVSSAKAKVKAKSVSSVKPKAAAASTECTIKGNISATKEKIYHVIGCPNYNQTIIDTSKGESMFCSEAEAKSAGWRKALNCK